MLFAWCFASQTLWDVSKLALLRQSPSLKGQLRMFSFFLRVRLVYISCEESCDEVMTQQLPCVFGSSRGTERLCRGAGSWGSRWQRLAWHARFPRHRASRALAHRSVQIDGPRQEQPLAPWQPVRENHGGTAGACAQARRETSGAMPSSIQLPGEVGARVARCSSQL